MAYDHDYGDKGSSTSLSARSCTYDVFLSFAGQDTRYAFTGHLYNALCEKGIKTFMDTKLHKGEEISQALIDTIEQSKIAIVVFSENYAESPWCLDELAKIVGCKNTEGQIVIPVFYHVEPSDVRRARNSYGKALIEHEREFKDKEKVDHWRSALREVSNLVGWPLKKGDKYEHEIIKEIVASVYTRTKSKTLLVANHPVGLEPRISEVRSILETNSDGVAMVGICGMGGIGKTTIAQGLYNTLVHQYESSCFIGDVRESAAQNLVTLQKKLLSEITGDDENLTFVNEGKSKITQRLHCKKVLLVLDDVDKLAQLEALAGGRDWFGKGSGIIITTRDRHLLRCHGLAADNIWEAQGLNDREALELFCWAAFKKSTPDATFADISDCIVKYSKGIPLVLKVIGSDLSGRGRDKWESAFKEYQRFPIKEIHDVLKISYNDLRTNVKEIFLDIACFFKGWELDRVMHILEACDFLPKSGIEKLVDKSLIYIEDNKIGMHDQIQEMGWKIVEQQSPAEPSKRSRLWNRSDIVNLLESDSGTEQIQGILLEGERYKTLSGQAFRKMKNLRILIIRVHWISQCPKHLPSGLRVLDWRCYPSPFLPKDFDGRKLAVLDLQNSKITFKLPLKEFANLKCLDFNGSYFLEQIPDVSGIPHLSELRANYCRNLWKVHDSVGFLKKLVKFSASHCSIKSFPYRLMSKVMEFLDISYNKEIDRFSDILVEMGNITSILVVKTSIKELPPSFGNLVGVEYLDLTSCELLENISSSFFALQNLKVIKMDSCKQALKAFRRMSKEGSLHAAMVLPNLVSLNMRECDLTQEDIPLLLSCFPKLRELFISKNYLLSSLPACFKEFFYLEKLDMHDCSMLQEISGLPPNISTINALCCESLNQKSLYLLASMGLLHVPGLHLMWSGGKLPIWFEHCWGGGRISFWVRGKFPMCCALYFFVRRVRSSLDLCINGNQVLKGSSDFLPRGDGSGVVLFDLRAVFKFQQGELDACLQQHEWNHVEIYCRVAEDFIYGDEQYKPRWCAIHVYRQQEVDMETDILFKSSYGYSEQDQSMAFDNPELENWSSNLDDDSDSELRRKEYLYMD